jgi:MOSC domain-containing protein YiiM
VLNPGSPLAALLQAPPRPGMVTWLGLRPNRRVPMQPVMVLQLDPAQGTLGDRYAGRSGSRHLTLLQAEHLAAIGSYLGLPAVDPARLRRNVVVSGLNLLALKGQRFRLGEAVLEMTGECHPCSRMEEEFGTGGYNAVRGHGGITARVLDSGAVSLGDALVRL